MFGYMGFNNINMYSFGAYNMFGGGCCNPFGSMMAANCLYNPFMMVETATQLMNGNFPTFSMNYTMPQYTLPSFGGLTSLANANYPTLQGSLFDDVYYSYGTGMTSAAPKFEAPILSNNFETDFELKGDLYDSFRFAPSAKKFTLASSTSAQAQAFKPQYTKLSGSHLTKEFLEAVKKSAEKIGCDYEDLLALMNSESSLDPAAVHKNKKGEKTAVGLIQFTKKYAIPDLNKKYNLNLTVEKIEKMSAIEQLDLVEKFYEMNRDKLPSGRKLTAADLYAVTYLPARADRDVLCRRGERKANGRLLGYYESNQGLDVNNDNKITKDDLNKRLAQKRVNLSTFA